VECFWLEDPHTITITNLCTVYVTMWKYIIILVQFQLHVQLFCSLLWFLKNYPISWLTYYLGA
jgi:hypothetical protein